MIRTIFKAALVLAIPGAVLWAFWSSVPPHIFALFMALFALIIASAFVSRRLEKLFGGGW